MESKYTDCKATRTVGSYAYFFSPSSSRNDSNAAGAFILEDAPQKNLYLVSTGCCLLRGAELGWRSRPLKRSCMSVFDFCTVGEEVIVQ